MIIVMNAVTIMIFNLDLSFTWNRPRINVYEDEGIIHKLLIIKHGNNEQNVTLHIQVDQTHQPFEAISGN